MTDRLSAILTDWLDRGEAAVLVTVAAARGSTPREVGAAMLVGATRQAGTIGGGRLEWEAVARARSILAGGAAPGALDLPLGPALGQCCGGVVGLTFQPVTAALAAELARQERAAADREPVVYLFGAGHVGKALASALALLPLRTVWVDARAAEFPDVLPSGVEKHCPPDPRALVAEMPAGSAMLVLTHCHDLDFDLAAAGLRRGDLAHVGLIGSATKRAKFLRRFRTDGGTAAQAGRLVCPIGGEVVRDKRPAVIAALAAAEVLTALAAYRPSADAPVRDCIACAPGRRCMDQAIEPSSHAAVTQA